MAHKLARLVLRMLKWGHEYADRGLQYYEERHRQQQVQLLKKRAAKNVQSACGHDHHGYQFLRWRDGRRERHAGFGEEHPSSAMD